MNLLKGSWVLKLAAFVFAALTYFYIHKELGRVEDKAADPSYKLIKLTAKNLPVKVRVVGVPPEGYHTDAGKASSDPSQVVVIGPEALLEGAFTAETAIVDVTDRTRTVKKYIPLESVAGIHLAGDVYNVDVTVPIEKVDTKEAPINNPSKN